LGFRIQASLVDAVSLMISESLGLVWLSNPSVTHGCSFVDDIVVPRGCLRGRIQASPVDAVWLMISEYRGAVWAVESKRDPWMQFR
jgi:hypothetical protein